MQSGRIKNAAIKASSQWDKNHASYLARLKRLRRGRLMGAWSSRHNNRNQWIQVDLGRKMKVTGVATQGREEANQWVTAFYVLYSSDGVKFSKVKEWWDVVKVSVREEVFYFIIYRAVRNALDSSRSLSHVGDKMNIPSFQFDLPVSEFIIFLLNFLNKTYSTGTL